MTDRRFRIILIVYFASVLTAMFAGLVPGGYSTGLSAAYEVEPYWLAEASLVVVIPIMLLIIGALVVGAVGLYLFKSWGRSLSFWLTLTAMPVTIVAGPTLTSGLESALWEISTLLWGALLALAYYSPVADSFRANNSLKSNPHQGDQHSR